MKTLTILGVVTCSLCLIISLILPTSIGEKLGWFTATMWALIARLYEK